MSYFMCYVSADPHRLVMLVVG